ncbi:MAG: hypothetical protein ACP5IE_02400 [Infirmifilum sp.]
MSYECEKRKELFCKVIRILMPVLNKHNVAVLKIYEYRENEAPSDVDIFVSLESTLKLIKELAEEYKARFIKKPRFLTSSFEVVIESVPNSLHLDLYYEFVLTPSTIVRRISPQQKAPRHIPWCEDVIVVPTLERAFDTFFILWHSLRHRVLICKDVRTVIKRFSEFNRKDIAKLVALIEWSKMSVEFYLMFYFILLLWASNVCDLNIPVDSKLKALTNIALIIEFLEKRTKEKGHVKALLAKLTHHQNLKTSRAGYKLYYLANYKHYKDVFRIVSINSIYYYLRFILVHFLREYALLVLLKLGLLR